MAVELLGAINRYKCESGDAKPTTGVKTGSQLFETDTRLGYIFDGAAWVQDAKVTLAGTSAISAATLPLPAGAATSAKQDTGNTALDAIKTAVEGTVDVNVAGSTIAEQLADADAVANVLTFGALVTGIEIWHDEAGLETFVVNGLTLEIGPGGWRSLIGGTPSAEVTIPAGVTCAVARVV